MRNSACDTRVDFLNKQRNILFYFIESPIRSQRNLCIQPSTADCNPPENTTLVYKKDRNCDHDYMDFL
jgi:hypothetical protein